MQRGRRAQAIILPPDYDEKDGIFFLTVSKECVVLNNRFTKATCNIPASEVPPFQTDDDLVIKENFSETRAALKSRYDPAHPGFLCSKFLPNFVVDESVLLPSPPRIAHSRSKSMKAIEDSCKLAKTTHAKPKAIVNAEAASSQPASPAAGTPDPAPDKGSETEQPPEDEKINDEAEDDDDEEELNEVQGADAKTLGKQTLGKAGDEKKDDTFEEPPPPVVA